MVHISSATYEYLVNKSRFVIEDRGLIEVKGKGRMQTYLILNQHNGMAPEYSV